MTYKAMEIMNENRNKIFKTHENLIFNNLQWNCKKLLLNFKFAKYFYKHSGNYNNN